VQFRELLVCGAENYSIEQCPLFDVEPPQIEPAPLHLTLGIVGHALLLGIEAFVFESGAAAVIRAARAVGVPFLVSAAVCPAPYHGGRFEEPDFHRIAQRTAAASDGMIRHLSAARLTTLRRAWTDWSDVTSVLHRAEYVPVANARDYQATASRLASGLCASCPWMRVTLKLDALVHHAPTFLLHLGSLGSYDEQALEACPEFLNHALAHCTADSILGSFLRLVERVARERQPAAAHMLHNGQIKKAAAPGARTARNPDDRHLRQNQPATRSTTVGEQKELAEMEAWAAKVAKKSSLTICAYNNRLDKATSPAAMAAAAAAAATVAVGAAAAASATEASVEGVWGEPRRWVTVSPQMGTETLWKRRSWMQHSCSCWVEKNALGKRHLVREARKATSQVPKKRS